MSDSMPIYLDHNATTPIDAEAAEAMLPYLHEHFGNPSSAHAYGHVTRRAVGKAREQIAALLGCASGEVVFTSGGTEANNMVIKGVAEQESSGHIITSTIEHPAVLEPCRWLKTRGFRVTVLPVDAAGCVDPADVAAVIDDDTILVSIMLANNEVGTLQPVAEIAAIAHAHGARMHTDAAQAMGKIAVNVDRLSVDYLSVAGHKLYAPKGIGALYVRAGCDLPKFMHGASHEGNRRAGTENVLAIVGLGMAAHVAARDLDRNKERMQQTRDRLWERLDNALPDVTRNGHPTEGLPNTLSVSFKNVEANALLDAIGEQVAASAGAACHADQVTVSVVLQAMAVPLPFAMGTLRLTTGKHTTLAEIDTAANVIIDAVRQLRQ